MRKALLMLGMVASLQMAHAIPTENLIHESRTSINFLEELSVEAKCCPDKRKDDCHDSKSSSRCHKNDCRKDDCRKDDCRKDDCRRDDCRRDDCCKDPCHQEKHDSRPCRGTTGATGPTGPAGPEVVQAYINLSLTTQTQTVPSNDFVVFNGIGPLLNVINGNPTVVLQIPGTYAISYGAATHNNDNLHYVVLLLNGNTVPGSLLPVSGQPGSAQFSSNTVLATVPQPNSTLQLQSICPVNDPLIIDGGIGLGASLTVLRISD